MKDLDFDELDRAVNTLMGSVPKTDDSHTDPETKTVSITPTLPSESSSPAPADATPVSQAAPTTPSTPPAPTPSLATRRGGRFMDVVHSSSDMKKDKQTTPISRQGTTIEPTKPVVPDMPKPTSPAPTVEPATPSAPEQPSASSDVPSSSSSSDWPDPLEMSGFDKLEENKPEPEAIPEPTPLLEESSETPVTAPVSEDLQPLSSPFLADAKVEKRPLGGASSTETEDVPEPDHTPVVPSADDSGTINNPNDQLPPAAEELKKELPPEYQGDLVAIESGSVEPPVVAPLETPEEAKPEEAPKEQKKTDSHPAALLEAKTEDDHAFAGPTSIAQQYKEEPSTGDQHNGAIYDTEAYHKPLAHPAKKKSGWMVVIWILVILVVGAGAGAALYFSGIF